MPALPLFIDASVTKMGFYTNSDYKVDRGATKGDAEAQYLCVAQGDDAANEALVSKKNGAFKYYVTLSKAM